MIEATTFRHLNGFYRRKDCRAIVYSLYKGICQGCKESLYGREDYDTGHILPRSKPEEFEELFPGLDVDNLVNLYLLCHRCNRGVGNFSLSSPALLHRLYSYSARMITTRLHKILEGEFINAELLHSALIHRIFVDFSPVYSHGICISTYHKLPLHLLEECLFTQLEEHGVGVSYDKAYLEYHLLKTLQDKHISYIATKEVDGVVLSFQAYRSKADPLRTVREDIQRKFSHTSEATAIPSAKAYKWLYLAGQLSPASLPGDVFWASESERTLQNLLRIYTWCKTLLGSKEYRSGKFIAVFRNPVIEMASAFMELFSESVFEYLAGVSQKDGTPLLPRLAYASIQKHEFVEGVNDYGDEEEIENFITRLKSKSTEGNYTIVRFRQLKRLEQQLRKILIEVQEQLFDADEMYEYTTT